MSRFIALVIAVVLIISTIPALAHDNYELEDGRWFTLYDENHNVLLRTGIRIHVGDKFLSSDNKLYTVYRVDNNRLRAWARVEENPEQLALPTQSEGLEGADNNRIALYHTHSGESFIPSDGFDSTDQGPGGIYQVGAEFASALEENTADVIHSQETFFPYSGSYRRSRRAALELVQEGLDAIFDVHRDAAPWGEYFTVIDDIELTQVLLVVGTHNPNFRVNEQFAYQLKNVGDAMYPDLVKGIFYAQGDYNQDLHPRALLLEMGAHTNSREHAEEGAMLFADVVAKTLYGGAPVDTDGNDDDIQENPQLQPTVDPPDGAQGGVMKGILTLFGLLGLGGGAFMFISTGSWTGVKEKLVEFKNNEFKDVVSRIPWQKMHPEYLFAQFKEIKLGKGDLSGLPEHLRDLWQKLFNRRKI